MKTFISIITFLTILATGQLAEAQNSDVQLTLQPGHEMKIDGSANVRDWDADVKTIDATFVLSGFDFSSLESLNPGHFKTMELTIPVRDIESDSGRLTRNLHGYLKRDEHPTITFNMNEVDNVTVENNEAKITANGIITAAGVAHETTMNVTATLNDGTITFSGAQDLLMTDFNIDPPTAVMGTIRSRDEITIIYELTFSNN